MHVRARCAVCKRRTRLPKPRPRPVEPSPMFQGASTVSSVSTLCNTALGAGVLGLPFAFKCAGAQLFSAEAAA